MGGMAMHTTSDVSRLWSGASRVRGVLSLAFGAILILAGCSTGVSSTPSHGSAPTELVSEPLPSATAALSGAWAGDLADANGTYPVRMTLAGCDAVGAACGEMEYLEPSHPDTVLCASELTLPRCDGDGFSFSERYVYHG